MKDSPSIASYVASLGAVVLAHVNEIATVVGVVLAIATFFVNLHFKRKMLDLAQRRGVPHGPENDDY
jgi:hypothetical protein